MSKITVECSLSKLWVREQTFLNLAFSLTQSPILEILLNCRVQSRVWAACGVSTNSMSCWLMCGVRRTSDVTYQEITDLEDYTGHRADLEEQWAQGNRTTVGTKDQENQQTQRNSGTVGTEEQQAQRNSRHRGTEEHQAQRSTRHRGTVGTDKLQAQRNRRYRGTDKHYTQRNSGIVGTEEQQAHRNSGHRGTVGKEGIGATENLDIFQRVKTFLASKK